MLRVVGLGTVGCVCVCVTNTRLYSGLTPGSLLRITQETICGAKDQDCHTQGRYSNPCCVSLVLSLCKRFIIVGSVVESLLMLWFCGSAHLGNMAQEHNVDLSRSRSGSDLDLVSWP